MSVAQPLPIGFSSVFWETSAIGFTKITGIRSATYKKPLTQPSKWRSQAFIVRGSCIRFPRRVQYRVKHLLQQRIWPGSRSFWLEEVPFLGHCMMGCRSSKARRNSPQPTMLRDSQLKTMQNFRECGSKVVTSSFFCKNSSLLVPAYCHATILYSPKFCLLSGFIKNDFCPTFLLASQQKLGGWSDQANVGLEDERLT